MKFRARFFWLSLVVVLAGTPARQVEAANDCARTLAEQDDDDRRVEEVDGGVGDDALEAIETGDDIQAASAPSSARPDLLAGMSRLIPSASPVRPETNRSPVPGGAPLSPARRQAWLQRFLL